MCVCVCCRAISPIPKRLPRGHLFGLSPLFFPRKRERKNWLLLHIHQRGQEICMAEATSHSLLTPMRGNGGSGVFFFLAGPSLIPPSNGKSDGNEYDVSVSTRAADAPETMGPFPFSFPDHRSWAPFSSSSSPHLTYIDATDTTV